MLYVHGIFLTVDCFGYNPHAGYTVSRELLDVTVTISSALLLLGYLPLVAL